MTVLLRLYRLATRFLEPFAPWLVAQRIRRGKEDPGRIRERMGVAGSMRPAGLLIWMHAASVGEARVLLDLIGALREQRPELRVVMTTQTMTSARIVGAYAPGSVIHQMAPLDTPGAVDAFLDHWRPAAAVFAEGEIWPNMLIALQKRRIKAALVNARMTAKTLRGWMQRSDTARQIFSGFVFIGAADRPTAEGLGTMLRRRIETVGNLKAAMLVIPPRPELVAEFRDQTGARPILLAASTHAGEEDFALAAFLQVRERRPDALLIIVPRHPDRAGMVMASVRAHGLRVQRWSADRSIPKSDVDLLLGDTIGELLFWYAVSDAVYLGGATAENVGGHNPIEPAQLGKQVFTGPHGFNFAEIFDEMASSGAIVIGRKSEELGAYWLAALERSGAAPGGSFQVSASRASFEATLGALHAMLPGESGAHHNA